MWSVESVTGLWAKKNPTTCNKISLEANFVLEMLTKNGAAAVGLSEVNGSIDFGKRANFIMLV